MSKRLVRWYEPFPPRDVAKSVRVKMKERTNAVPEERRQKNESTLREGIRPPQNNEDREKALLDRVDRAKTSDERDQLYLQLARLFTETGDSRARDYVAQIEDSELRQKARAFINVTMVMREGEK